MNTNTTTPPDWYATPEGGLRYWDGQAWTDHYVAPTPSQPQKPAISSGQWTVIIGLLILLALPVVMLGVLGALLAPVESGQLANPPAVEQTTPQVPSTLPPATPPATPPVTEAPDAAAQGEAAMPPVAAVPASKEVSFGEVRDLGHGNSSATLTLTNSQTQTMDYEIAVRIEDPFASGENRVNAVENVWVRFSDVAPGETVQLDVLSSEGKPATRQFTVVDANRTAS